MMKHRAGTISSSAKKRTKPKKQQHQKEQNTEFNRFHCICDCPQLENIDSDKLLNFNEQNTSTGGVRDKMKPFRTGKDPESLISKRHFDTVGDGNKSSSELKLHKGEKLSFFLTLK